MRYRFRCVLLALVLGSSLACVGVWTLMAQTLPPSAPTRTPPSIITATPSRPGPAQNSPSAAPIIQTSGMSDGPLDPPSVAPRSQTAGAANRSLVVNPGLGAPSNLLLTGLDSTIRANWTASTDPNVAWQVFAVWDGPTLIGTKVLSRTAFAADANGLQSNHPYMITVQSMNAAGDLSPALSAQAFTDMQMPMANAAFFESFNDSPHGNLDNHYFDVRYIGGLCHPRDIPDTVLAFVNERHFHTQLTGGTQTCQVMLRPRGVFDFAGRTGTFQFEVDMAPTQTAQGKWFEIHLSRNTVANAEQFGNVFDQLVMDDDITFSVQLPTENASNAHLNQARIHVNSGGVAHEYAGTMNNVTPANIRVPVVLKVSQTAAEMFINGQSAVQATGFTLPFTRGDWLITHRNSYANRSVFFPVPLQLVHWDTIQFDGPAGTVSPVRKAYVADGCPVITGSGFDCLTPSDFTIQVPDSPAAMTTGRLLFNGGSPDGAICVGTNDVAMNTATLALTGTLNGHGFSAGSNPANGCYFDFLYTADIAPGWLVPGANAVHINTNNLTQVRQAEIEVTLNQPRVIGNMPLMPEPMLSVTSNSLEVLRPTTGSIRTFTTFLYNQGANQPINYTVSIPSAENAWLTPVSPTTGTILPIPVGGALVPLTFQVDYSQVLNDEKGVGLIKVAGGNMPVYIGVFANPNTSQTYPVSNPLSTQAFYSKCGGIGVPGYEQSCAGSLATPTVAPTGVVTATPLSTQTSVPLTATVTVVPVTATPIPPTATPNPVITATPQPVASPTPCFPPNARRCRPQ